MSAWTWRTRADGIVEVDRHLGNGFGVATLPALEPGIAAAIKRSLQWRVAVEQFAAPHGMSVPWCLGVIYAESGGVRTALSPAGARGLMQIMPSTGKMLGVANEEDLYNSDTNIDAGARYLMSFANAGYDVVQCASMYNAGPSIKGGPKSRAVSVEFPWGLVEDQGYILRVVSATNHFTQALGYAPSNKPRKSGVSWPVFALIGYLAWKYGR